MGIGINYLQTILHGRQNGDIARRWSHNKRQNGLSIEKGINSQLESGNSSFLSFFKIKYTPYANKLIENEIQELTHKIYKFTKGGPK